MVKAHLGGKQIWGANGLTFGGPMVWGQWSWGPIVHIPTRSEQYEVFLFGSI